MSCCTGENHSCHHSSQKEKNHKKEQHKDCNDTSCPINNNCHIQTFSIKLMTKQQFQTTEIAITLTEKVINEHYSTLILKELIYSFWHPPKYIS